MSEPREYHGDLSDFMNELMTPPTVKRDKWSKFRVRWASLCCDGVWKNNALGLRVAKAQGREDYYVAPYNAREFQQECVGRRIGPYPTLAAAQAAAEMLKEMKEI